MKARAVAWDGVARWLVHVGQGKGSTNNVSLMHFMQHHDGHVILHSVLALPFRLLPYWGISLRHSLATVAQILLGLAPRCSPEGPR